jgi:hypothetical protein
MRIEEEEIETIKALLEHVESTRFLLEKEKALLNRCESTLKTLNRTKSKKAKLPRNYFR